MDRAALIRPALFSAYGVAIGAGYVAVMHPILPGGLVGLVFGGLVLPAFSGYMGWSVANISESSNFQRLLLLPLYPVALLAGIFGMAVILMVGALIYPIALVGAMKDERQFRTRMKSKGRFLDGVDLDLKLEAGEGTLIEETGHKGPYHIWWIGENILDKGIPPSTKEDILAVLQGNDHSFNSQCLKEYLDLNTGKAFLTSIPPRRVKSDKFTRMYPRMSIVTVVRPYCTELNDK